MVDNNEIVFDKYKVNTFLNKNKNSKFPIPPDNGFISLFPDSSKYNNTNVKYFVDIHSEKEQYIGAFSSNFKRELFAYILFNQKDEYLGQILKEKKHGFGIYKFNCSNEGKDIYIGNFSENNIIGEGIYIKIINYEKKEEKIIPTKYICHIGLFENGELKSGKIFTVDNNLEKLEFKDDSTKEKNKDGKEAIYIEKKGDITLFSKGILKENKLIEGYAITTIKNNEKIENKFSYKIKDDLNYAFHYLEDKPKEKELLDGLKKSNFSKFRKTIKDILDEIEKMISEMKKNFDYALKLNMGDNFKDYFSKYINILMK